MGRREPDEDADFAAVLRRLRWTGTLLPVACIAALSLFRPVLAVSDRHLLVLDVLLAVLAVAFGLTIFSLVERARRLLVHRHHELAAVNAVATAVRGDVDLPQVAHAALGAVLDGTGARAAELTWTSTEGSSTWRRAVGGGAAPSAAHLAVPLVVGAERLGELRIEARGGSAGQDLSTATLTTVGEQVASALHRSALVADLRRRSRESAALSRLTLRISEQEPVGTTLAALVGDARSLLGADDTGLCLPPVATELNALTDVLCPGPGGQVCILADGGPGCPERSGPCPLLEPPAGPSAAAPVRVFGAEVGRLWLCRDTPLSTRDEAVLADLAGLAVVALEHARMVENERSAATIAERERIAREMHDSLAQVLGVTHLRLLALTGSPGLGDDARGELGELVALCHDAYLDVREAILGLREASRTDRSLLESLRVYTEKFSRQARIRTELVADVDGEPALGPHGEVQVIRVIQEALTNVRKHSGATRATVRVTGTPDEAVFEVSDDGVGFDPARVPTDRDRFGLHAMRERTELLGGGLTVDSAVGAGTRVTVRVPRVVRAPRVPRVARVVGHQPVLAEVTP